MALVQAQAAAVKLSRAEQKAATRQVILDATIEALVAEGYDNFTIRDVAERAGVAQGLINYHFDSREELLEEAESRILTGLLQRVASSLEVTQINTARQRVDILDLVLHELRTAEGLLPIFISLANRAVHDEVYRERFLAHLEGHRQLVYSTLHAVAGDLLEQAEIDIRDAATVLVALASGLTVLQHLSPDSDDASRALDTFKNIVMDALALRLGRRVQDA